MCLSREICIISDRGHDSDHVIATL